MTRTYRVAAGMPVVAADGKALGYVTGCGTDHVMLTSVKGGQGFEHSIPLAWVEAVDRYVFLSRSSSYVEAHRQAVVRDALNRRPIAA